MPGPPVSRRPPRRRARGAGGARCRCTRPRHRCRHPDRRAARARVTVDAGRVTAIHVELAAGDPLDEVVLRSYAIGAAHMALGWVTSEGLAVDPATGEIHDLTIRSFGVLRPAEMPPVAVTILDDPAPARARSTDAVFAAVAAAAWNALGRPVTFPAPQEVTMPVVPVPTPECARPRPGRIRRRCAPATGWCSRARSGSIPRPARWCPAAWKRRRARSWRTSPRCSVTAVRGSPTSPRPPCSSPTSGSSRPSTRSTRRRSAITSRPARPSRSPRSPAAPRSR